MGMRKGRKRNRSIQQLLPREAVAQNTASTSDETSLKTGVYDPAVGSTLPALNFSTGPILLDVIQGLLCAAKDSHLGWLSLVMALELRQRGPRQGCNAPSAPSTYLFELYGMLLEGLGMGISQGLGSELVVAMVMLACVDISVHGCPEPALIHLQGLETLLHIRHQAMSAQLPDESQHLDGFAFDLVRSARGVTSVSQECDLPCPDHPGGQFAWNVCVSNQPQVAQLRDYVFGFIELVNTEILLTTNGLQALSNGAGGEYGSDK